MQNTTKQNHNTPHPYAEILRAIADGKQLQYYDQLGQKYKDLDEDAVFYAILYKTSGNCFRIKPETILINGIEVPKPCDKQLDAGQQYFYPCIEASDLCTGTKWRHDDIYDKRLLNRGLVHLTKEAAIKHAEALLSFTSNGGAV